MKPSDIAPQLIGSPWAVGADGPDRFGCYGLVRYVYRECYGIILPEVADDVGEPLASRHAIMRESGSWHKVFQPWQEGDVVTLTRGLYPEHVGIWLEADGGGVLHSARGSGVQFHSVGKLAVYGWHIVAAYRMSA